jgi:hypothetical protein
LKGDAGVSSGDGVVVSERRSASSVPGETSSLRDAISPAAAVQREVVATAVDDAQPAAVIARTVPVVTATPVAIKVVTLLNAGEGSVVSDSRPGSKAVFVSSPSYSVQALAWGGGADISAEIVEEHAGSVIEAKAPKPGPRALPNAGGQRHARRTTRKDTAVVAETSDRWVEKFYRDY